MSSILYYSNYCDKSKAILTKLAKSKIQEDIHFICIDKRVKTGTTWHIVLETGAQVLLPPQVNKVPALLLLNKQNQVLYGEQILQHLQPLDTAQNNSATNFNGEPMAFSLCNEGLGGFGVASDTYSYLDQSPDELSAKGNGGMRQLHNYATINQVDKIETPPDNYSPDKVKDVSVETLQSQRERDIKIEDSPLNPNQHISPPMKQVPSTQRPDQPMYQMQQYQEFYPPMGVPPQQMAIGQGQGQGQGQMYSQQVQAPLGQSYYAPPQNTQYSRLQNAQQQQQYNQQQTQYQQYQQPQYSPQQYQQQPGQYQQQQQQQQHAQYQQQYSQHQPGQYQQYQPYGNGNGTQRGAYGRQNYSRMM
jgi:hypothetical protein